MTDIPNQTPNADDSYERILDDAISALKHRDTDAFVVLSEQLMNLGRDRAETFALMGLFALIGDDLGRAIQMFETAHDLDPECREYAEGLASMNAYVGKLADALYFAKLAATLDGNPRISAIMGDDLRDFARALMIAGKSVYYLRAVESFLTRDYGKSADFCRKHLQIERNDCAAYVLLGRCALQIGDYDQALSSLHTAIHLQPDDAVPHVLLAHALNGLGRSEEAEACAKRAESLAPDDAEVHALVVAARASLNEAAWWENRKALTAWTRKNVTPRRKRPGHLYDPAEGRRIRIGVMAAGVHGRSAEMPFLEAVLPAHSRGQFEYIGYQPFAVQDNFTVKMQNVCDAWVELQDIDPYTAGLIVENDGIDIMLDLSGYQEGGRHDVLRQRVAPVQVAMPLYGEGAFLPGADYLISDPVLRDVDEKMCPKDQKPLVMDGGAFVLSPFVMVDDPADSPFSATGQVTFGAVADMRGLSGEFVEQICQILRDVPHARVVFGYVHTLPKQVQERIVDVFAHAGMAGRVLFHEGDAEGEPTHGLSPKRQEFFSQIDVFLDGGRWSDPLAVAQALWMGVPVVAGAFGRRAARMGASALYAAGRRDWIAHDPKEYVSIACALVADQRRLEALGRSLRDEVKDSDLFNARKYMQRLEAVFLSILNK